MFYWTDAPTWAQESLLAYAEHGLQPGDCLRAVLTNDLMEAFKRADDDTGRHMAEIVSFVYNRLPMNCHGSAEIVDGWIQEHHERRQNKTEVAP